MGGDTHPPAFKKTATKTHSGPDSRAITHISVNTHPGTKTTGTSMVCGNHKETSTVTPPLAPKKVTSVNSKEATGNHVTPGGQNVE